MHIWPGTVHNHNSKSVNFCQNEIENIDSEIYMAVSSL